MGEKKKKKRIQRGPSAEKKTIGYGLVPLDRRQQETKEEEEEPQVGSDKEEKW